MGMGMDTDMVMDMDIINHQREREKRTREVEKKRRKSMIIATNLTAVNAHPVFALVYHVALMDSHLENSLKALMHLVTILC